MRQKLPKPSSGDVRYYVVLGMVWGWQSGVLAKKCGWLVEEVFKVTQPPIGMTATFDATTGTPGSSTSMA